ncbi:hypothetical protein C8T65DRAFT_829814 [Cerioporus squamosus]|nr:hypothetical protein C8T65DRAFT_829814 [Cerioporus squamosus]
MQASLDSSTQPEVELPVGRLPKPPPKLLGPLKHLMSNYQLYAAQQYYVEGRRLVKGLGEEYPGWKEKPQFGALVSNGNTVASYLDDAFDQPKWDREKNRTIKHEARKYRTSAYRSSMTAEREYVNDMVPRLPETEDVEQRDLSRPSSPGVDPRDSVPLFEPRTPMPPPSTDYCSVFSDIVASMSTTSD